MVNRRIRRNRVDPSEGEFRRETVPELKKPRKVTPKKPADPKDYVLPVLDPLAPAPNRGCNPYGLNLDDITYRLVMEYIKDYQLPSAAARVDMVDDDGKPFPRVYEIYRSREFKEAIYLIEKDRDERYKCSKEKVIRELSSIAFANVKDILESDPDGFLAFKKIDDLPEHVTKSIKKIRFINSYSREGELTQNITAEFYDKISAIDKLGKQMGMFTERRELTGADGAPLMPKAPTKIVFDFGSDLDSGEESDT